ncbi:MAG TPA: RDD family protein [Dehalococcoidia bacterium]
MAERLAASRMPRNRTARASVDDSENLSGILGARSLAYFIDSLMLCFMSVAFIGVGFGVLLLRSHGGTKDVPDAALWDFVFVSLATIPALALILFAFLARRGQTVGHYMTGLIVVREDQGNPRLRQLLLYLLALHPLVFHPVLAGFWLLFAYISLSLTSSNVLVLGSLGVAILCLLGPLVALAMGMADAGHRGLHDRIAGLMVVRLE